MKVDIDKRIHIVVTKTDITDLKQRAREIVQDPVRADQMVSAIEYWIQHDKSVEENK